ncbi:MAG: ABC transporter ATP-binding protein/permease [Rickettsiales bacterium]|jgi:ATP-binding cassette subfamily B protein|nr:ABC transporter ATP-binding protein/permease [Rickettsiales bacterium]
MQFIVKNLVKEFIKSNRLAVTANVLLSLVGKAVALMVMPLAYRKIMLKLGTGVDASGYVSYIISFYIIHLIDSVFNRLSSLIKLKFNFRNKMVTIHNYILNSILLNSREFFTSKSSTAIASTIFRLSEVFLDIINNIITDIIPGLVILMIYLLFMFTVDINIFLIILGYMLICQILFVYLDKKIVNKLYNQDKDEISLSDKLGDILLNMDAVKIFTAEKREKIKLLGLSDENIKKQNNIDRKFTIFRFIEDILYVIINIIFFVLIAIIIKNDINNLIFIYFSLRNLNGQNLNLTDSIFTLGRNFNKAKDFIEDLTDEGKIMNSKTSVCLKKVEGRVNFSNISFHYGTNLPFVFKNFNLLIEANQKIGIVGYSGAGKTTLLNLLLRFYDVNNGNIYIDNYDIKTGITQESLRKNISYIPQEIILFHRTIKENILYGCPKTTEEQLIEACKKAQCYDFIISFKDKFDTIVGGRGAKLSSGQRQRIAIARALLRDTKIVILDEATAALDSITEKRVQKGLKYLMKDKTVIAVTHRLSTLSYMDRIIVLDNSKIVEDGTIRQLLSIESGLFKKMWSLQKEIP